MLPAGNHENVQITVHKTLVGLVLDKSGDEEHYVVKLASELALQQVQKILCFVFFKALKGSFPGSMPLYTCACVCVCLCVNPRVRPMCLVLHRFQLPAHDVQLRVRNGEDVAVCVSRA